MSTVFNLIKSYVWGHQDEANDQILEAQRRLDETYAQEEQKTIGVKAQMEQQHECQNRQFEDAREQRDVTLAREGQEFNVQMQEKEAWRKQEQYEREIVLEAKQRAHQEHMAKEEERLQNRPKEKRSIGPAYQGQEPAYRGQELVVSDRKEQEAFGANFGRGFGKEFGKKKK